MLFNDILNKKIENNTNLVGLTTELKAILISNMLNIHNKSSVVVTNSLFEATNLYHAILNHTDKVLFFPMDDFLTSEALAISPELKMMRLETLNQLCNDNKSIIVTNLMGYLRYLPPVNIYKKKIINICVNDEYPINELIEDLYACGYSRETIVNKTGEVAVRGFVIDVFPNNLENPIRIEYWGDTIESIKIFDINTQFTKEIIKSTLIMPNTELIVDGKVDLFNKTQKEIVNYLTPINISKFLENPITFYDDYYQIKASHNHLVEEIFNYNISIHGDKEKTYMFDFSAVEDLDSITFAAFDEQLSVEKTQSFNSFDLPSIVGGTEVIKETLNKYLSNNKKVVVTFTTNNKLTKLYDALEDNNIVITDINNIYDSKINFIVKSLSSGFIIDDLVVYSERELFNKTESKSTYKTNFKFGTKIRDISKLNHGDFVVHSIHGIGIYAGVKTITKNGIAKDYLEVDYKGHDKLYIPVEKINLITKYASSDGAVPKISKLGGTDWQKTKEKVKKRIENIAGELLEIYAKREALLGYAFPKDDNNQLDFEKEFPYVETEDQLKVTEEIKKDMENVRPMDRLLCGDVGFGKTEVAFRAIFKAVLAGKQVMLLCPTTILSRQHYLNAKERFKSYPINISLLNRFVTPKETKKTLDGLKEGKVDIVIGTHRLLSSDIAFKDLGLMIVDEEQRFGVKHKERMKKMKTNIDVLTLSATPIPRTIQMTLAGIRSLSIIETPPVNRYPVQTYVLAENNQIIKDAIYKELSRNGQVFVLYNSIEDMNVKMAEIKRLVPEAKIISAHGQMPKNMIEDVMIRFTNREYDVLLCTTIIETGIDIPSVNTLIIIDADHFGLSQLYQIRGRVGRSNKIAYCYLMYNKGKVLSEIATKRLKVIKEFTELGSGFAIAMRDLAIRGAGDILGSEQAGFVDSIGIELFTKMLKEEIDKIRGIVTISDDIEDQQPLLEVKTTIDDSYVKEEELKIEIHKKINEIDSYEKILSIKAELEDRFGKVSDDLIVYMYEEWFEKIVKKIKIFKINQTRNFIEVILDKDLTNKINGAELFVDVNNISRMFRFSMKFGKLTITLDTVKLEKHFIYYLIELMLVLEKIKV